MAKTVYKLTKLFNGEEVFNKTYEDRDKAFKEYENLEFHIMLNASDSDFYEANQNENHKCFDITYYEEDEEYNCIIKLETINNNE